MEEAVIYDAVSDVGGNFTPEFSNYVRNQKLICKFWLNFYYPAWLFSHDHQPDGVDSTHSDLTNKLITIFELLRDAPLKWLVQFWKAEELNGVDNLGERFVLLTTRNQPFLIRGSYYENPQFRRICSYRMKMDDIVTREGGGGGVIGRVYQSKRLEFTPNIGYYSSEEYPHLDLALACGISCSYAIPISDSFGRLVGVLEGFFQDGHVKYFLEGTILGLQRGSNHRYYDHCKDLCGQCDVEDKSLHEGVAEIKTVMGVIGRSCDLDYAQTWIVCSHFNSLSISERLHDKLEASYKNPAKQANYVFGAEYACNHLKTGEGVVGKAVTSSHNLVYCEDVSQFSVTRYPFAHCARHYKLASSFAICLKSDLTQNQIYVLEFFLNKRKVYLGNLKATLIPILNKMRQNFRTFKLASGEEIRDNLFVHVIDAHSPDKIVSLRKRNRNRNTSLAISTNNIEGRKRYVLSHSIGESSTWESTNDPEEETSVFSTSTIQSKCLLTIKVNYGGDLFTFELSSSSEIHELNQQVSQRLNLEGGSYNLKYQDDDGDWILITCDEDLNAYILSSMQQEKYTLTMTIEPK